MSTMSPMKLSIYFAVITFAFLIFAGTMRSENEADKFQQKFDNIADQIEHRDKDLEESVQLLEDEQKKNERVHLLYKGYVYEPTYERMELFEIDEKLQQIKTNQFSIDLIDSIIYSSIYPAKSFLYSVSGLTAPEYIAVEVWTGEEEKSLKGYHLLKKGKKADTIFIKSPTFESKTPEDVPQVIADIQKTITFYHTLQAPDFTQLSASLVDKVVAFQLTQEGKQLSIRYYESTTTPKEALEFTHEPNQLEDFGLLSEIAWKTDGTGYFQGTKDNVIFEVRANQIDQESIIRLFSSIAYVPNANQIAD
ncbi:hypothetical protein LCL95_00700 [Bacillus timonensis]|nr:hypothetical protein [Bacillus timonensis]